LEGLLHPLSIVNHSLHAADYMRSRHVFEEKENVKSEKQIEIISGGFIFRHTIIHIWVISSEAWMIFVI